MRFCCRPAAGLGGGLHGRGAQLLHQVSPPVCCVQGTGLGIWAPGRARFWAEVRSHVDCSARACLSLIYRYFILAAELLTFYCCGPADRPDVLLVATVSPQFAQ